MSKVAEWAENKPDHIAIIAIELARVVIYYFETNSESNDFPIEKLIDYPSTKEWLSYYHRSRYITNWLISVCKKGGGYFSLISEALEFLMGLPSTKQFEKQKANRKDFEELKKGKKIDNSILKNFKEVILEELKQDNDNSEISLNLENELKKPEMLFFIKVGIPCLFFYKSHPAILLSQARNGDLKALDILLRIDKAIICDRRINEQLYRSSLLPNKNRFHELVSALRGTPKNKKNRVHAKMTMAGLISVFTEGFSHKLTAQDIRSLYDAFAADNKPGELIDTDFSDNPATFIKYVQRARSFWRSK